MSNDDVFIFCFIGCRLGKARKVGRRAREGPSRLGPRLRSGRPLATFPPHPTWEGISGKRLTNNRKCAFIILKFLEFSVFSIY